MILVVPYIGTWIETYCICSKAKSRRVVPYIGTWIETAASGMASYGQAVVPYIGTWIETVRTWERRMKNESRTLYRYVD